MKQLALLAVLILAAPAVVAQVLTVTPHGVVVAHDGRLLLDGVWATEGVEHATAIAADGERAIVLDGLNDSAVIADLRTGRTIRLRTAATPLAAVFVEGEIYVLARDARLLQRVGGADIAVAADPAFVRTANRNVYVYSRTSGVIEEIAGDAVSRRIDVAPFASDFEISGNTAYLVHPRDGRIRTVDLEAMTTGDEVAIGAVPVDLAFAGGGTALTARILAVADPSAKRVWMTEGAQSMFKAVARGFLRGFLGLGLFGSRASEFPTGVDRVLVHGDLWIAYDSSSRTLYRFTRRRSAVVAQGIAPGAFALTDEGVVYWQDGAVRVASASTN